MDVNIKLLDYRAELPTKGTEGSAGFDIKVTSISYDDKRAVWVYGTGIAMEIPKGYVGLCFPRSSIYRTPATLRNCVGVIDSDYRGEIMAMFKNFDKSNQTAPYQIGDKAIQMIIMPYPDITFKVVEELSDTERGKGGHGSTGK